MKADSCNSFAKDLGILNLFRASRRLNTYLNSTRDNQLKIDDINQLRIEEVRISHAIDPKRKVFKATHASTVINQFTSDNKLSVRIAQSDKTDVAAPIIP